MTQPTQPTEQDLRAAREAVKKGLNCVTKMAVELLGANQSVEDCVTVLVAEALSQARMEGDRAGAERVLKAVEEARIDYGYDADQSSPSYRAGIEEGVNDCAKSLIEAARQAAGQK